MKTLHIYSSTKIALILFYRNKLKSHLKISYFGFRLLETHVQRKWKLDVRHFILPKKEIEMGRKKKRFSASLIKSKSVAFSLLFTILSAAHTCNPLSKTKL